VHSATDITGFGLSGHSMQLAKASQVTLKIKVEALPKFSKSFVCLEKGFLTKAHRSNAEYTKSFIDTSSLDTLYGQLIHDPQTSGGLLLCVDSEFSQSIINSLKVKFPQTSLIGQVENLQQKAVVFE
jgi:selenide,water dikinase